MHVRRALVLLAFTLFLARPASAVEYEVFVDVENEEDLYDLLVSGQIEEDTFNTLLELLRRGVDLNRASRTELYSLPNLTYAEVDAILAYRAEAGVITDPVALVSAGVLSQEKFTAIAAFLVVQRGRNVSLIDGDARLPVMWTAGSDIPTAALQVRTRVGNGVRAGIAGVVTHNRIRDVVYDPARNALNAKRADSQLHVPKIFVLYEDDDYEVIAGSYRIGFGQRLTFDNTNRYTPNGFYLDDAIVRRTDLTRECKESAGELETSPCAGAVGDQYVAPDFGWRDGLRGIAAGLQRLEVGTAWIQTYAFASAQTHSIYQYEIYDRGRCDDPRNDDDENCSAPDVFARQDDPLAPTSRYSFQTLPDMYSQQLVGGNVTYFSNARTHLGVTGYGADTNWLTQGIDLDFQEWARVPYGGAFGAIGIDAAWGHSWADVFAEVAHSFDAMGSDDGGGGLAAILRSTASWGKNELELTARYYDKKYANPLARPISAPDEFDGLRARDETGVRLRYTGALGRRFRVRADADVWVQPSEKAPKLLLYARGDFSPSKKETYSWWSRFQDKDLTAGGTMQCYDVSTEFSEVGEPIPCGGNSWQNGARVRLAPSPNWYVVAQGQHTWRDESRYDDKRRHDVLGYLAGSIRFGKLALRSRLRYLFEDVSDNEVLEQSLWVYAEAAYRFGTGRFLRLRYDFVDLIDDRASTATRSPNPEHWLRMQIETRF